LARQEKQICVNRASPALWGRWTILFVYNIENEHRPGMFFVGLGRMKSPSSRTIKGDIMSLANAYLPCGHRALVMGKSVTFKSYDLAKHLGLKTLYACSFAVDILSKKNRYRDLVWGVKG